MPELIDASHYDEGPPDRYRHLYEPLTYNQEILAPLPGLYYCFRMADWDEDGLDGIILARNNWARIFKKEMHSQADDPTRPAGYGGFRDTAVYNLFIGSLYLFSGLVKTVHGQPIFSRLAALQVDGKSFKTYVGPYPSVFDVNGDGLKDLVIDTQRSGRPQLCHAGLIADGEGHANHSSFAFRFEPADMNGDGITDFVTGANFGNQDLFLLYLQINARTSRMGWGLRSDYRVHGTAHIFFEGREGGWRTAYSPPGEFPAERKGLSRA